MITGIHHIALICSNYESSKYFYTQILGLTIIHEAYRSERESHKLDLALNGQYVLELFSFPSPPQRVSQPEATGLRHLAFAVTSLENMRATLERHQITMQPIRTDEFTGKRFFFISDPDNLPIEFYET